MLFVIVSEYSINPILSDLHSSSVMTEFNLSSSNEACASRTCLSRCFSSLSFAANRLACARATLSAPTFCKKWSNDIRLLIRVLQWLSTIGTNSSFLKPNTVLTPTFFCCRTVIIVIFNICTFIWHRFWAHAASASAANNKAWKDTQFIVIRWSSCIQF